MTYESLLRIGEISININGDFEDDILIEKARRAERYVNGVWIGDSDFFKDPFHLAELFLENTDLIVGFGILRAKNCHRILKKLEKFSELEERVIVGVSAGDGGRIDVALKCIQKIKERFRIPVVAGGTGRRALIKLSRISDGFLLNHISPRHVDYALNYVKSDFVSAYGPCLPVPSKFEQDLLLATAIVMGSSKSFIRDMGYEDIFQGIEDIDVLGLIDLRQKGVDLGENPEYRKLERFRDFLLENFSISGSIDEISDKIIILLEKCSHVILSDPFFREENFDVLVRDITENLKKKV